MNGWLKLAAGTIIALIGWGGGLIYDNIASKVNENRSSIQALIDLHLSK